MALTLCFKLTVFFTLIKIAGNIKVASYHCCRVYTNCEQLTGLSGLAVACLTAVREVLGSNRAVGSCVYRKNHCDLQPWARAVCTFPAVPR